MTERKHMPFLSDEDMLMVWEALKLYVRSLALTEGGDLRSLFRCTALMQDIEGHVQEAIANLDNRQKNPLDTEEIM